MESVLSVLVDVWCRLYLIRDETFSGSVVPVLASGEVPLET